MDEELEDGYDHPEDWPNDYCKYGHYEEGNKKLPECSNEWLNREELQMERDAERKQRNYDDGLIDDTDH